MTVRVTNNPRTVRITKRPKRVNLIIKEATVETLSYTCPACKTIYIKSCPSINISRFVCECGQILIVHAKIREV